MILECGGDDEDEHAAPRWRVGVAAGGFATEIEFPGKRADVREASLVASGEYRLGPRLTVGLGAGAILDGQVEIDATTHDVAPGFLVAATGSYVILPGAGRAPFLLASASVGHSRTHTSRPGEARVSLTALDARVGLVAGKTFGRLSPYLAARAFLGPVAWRFAGAGITGTDAHHFQIGAGVSLRLPGGVDALLEVMPLGERAVTFGAGVSL